jgi:hypothetical protein
MAMSKHTHSWTRVGSRPIGNGQVVVTYVCICGATNDSIERE